jgi:hypothetical protein
MDHMTPASYHEIELRARKMRAEVLRNGLVAFRDWIVSHLHTGKAGARA